MPTVHKVVLNDFTGIVPLIASNVLKNNCENDDGDGDDDVCTYVWVDGWMDDGGC